MAKPGAEASVQSSSKGRMLSLIWKDAPFWTASISAGATFVAAVAFSPLYRRWNTTLTRRDILRKAVTSSAGAGCVGYAFGHTFRYSVDWALDENNGTISGVYGTLLKTNRSEFLASHPGNSNSVRLIDGPENAPSPPLSISERILTACYQSTTTSKSLQSMRRYLEHDLLASGVSQRDADIAITYAASGLDYGLVWALPAIPLFTALSMGRDSGRAHHRSALYRAPSVPRVLMLADYLLIGMAIHAGLTVLETIYVDSIQNKAAVAAVLRQKFRKELKS
ncbi:hypothetical protein EVJ58_g309 [Rhodofomes roseus]|uniref:Uncharacterized protein n=1 Tax=Rhodofomes roseus TaxID=34475 RepID=A0A4Y9Z726_9APHY|nr:hypothetical protein EVJ58_g309 [Rhodofomes roseus]